LIGEPGVGKTAIAEGLTSAANYRWRDVPQSLKDRKLDRFRHGVYHWGKKSEFEERLKAVLKEAMDSQN